MFVYLITNTVNGKRYVGQTTGTLAQRFWAHAHRNNCRYLYNAIQKHGKENFSIEVLFDVPTKELANEFEIEYIDKYRTLFPNGYNISPGGDERPPMSEEDKQKLAERMRGNTYGKGLSPSEETKKKLSDANKGRPLSEEHKRKISEKLKGNNNGLNSSRNLGIKASEETKAKMRFSQQKRRKENNVSDETKQRMRNAWKLRPSIEGNKKALGHVVSEEARKKMSAARKRYWDTKKAE